MLHKIAGKKSTTPITLFLATSLLFSAHQPSYAQTNIYPGSVIDVPITFTASEPTSAFEFNVSVINGTLDTLTCRSDSVGSSDEGYRLLASQAESCVIFNLNGVTSGRVATAKIVTTSPGSITLKLTGTASNNNGQEPQGFNYQDVTFTVTNPSPTPTNTAIPTATNTPRPTSTPTRIPTPTNTSVLTTAPTSTVTPISTTTYPTAMPMPTGTNIPQDTTAPAITITHPTNNQVVSTKSEIKLTASASDDATINKITFYINGNEVCTTTTEPHECSWTVPNQPQKYAIKATAFDNSGNSGSAVIYVESSARRGKYLEIIRSIIKSVQGLISPTRN